MNFINDKTAIEFLKKNKARLQSLAAAVIVAGSLTGCKEKTATPAEQYINNSVVITSATGEKYIVKKIARESCDEPLNENHYHYYDVITKSYYSDSEACLHFRNNLKDVRPLMVHILNIENIQDYLTTEEITKLIKNELTIEDCAEIISRIKESEIEEVKTK